MLTFISDLLRKGSAQERARKARQALLILTGAMVLFSTLVALKIHR